ncbi:30S ribosomal protein S19e [Candidatus Woesearchaeota archaeon]|nr:30S ribosomal protein S19e [Candidatus Woesearchaeota archaeon]
MVKAYDVSQDLLVKKLAEILEKQGAIKMPDWANFVKTGSNKDRAPLQKDWWYQRAASILRKVYSHGPIGVEKLRTKYGSKKNMGVRPEHFVKAGGKVIRVILQQLEAAGYIAKEEKSKNKGRIITQRGTSLVDKAAGLLHQKDAKKAKSKESKEIKEDGKVQTSKQETAAEQA